MKAKLFRLILLLACCLPLSISAQVNEEFTSPDNLLDEGRQLFLHENYAAAIPLVKNYIRLNPQAPLRYQAEYILAASAYELKAPDCLEVMENYLDTYPDSPFTNRIYALMASVNFFDGKYNEALDMFHLADLEKLSNDERDDMTYRMAVAYLETGNVNQAAIWFETLRSTSPKYEKDSSYYISYIRYTQKRYDEALAGFVPLEADEKYRTLVPYYIADINLQNRQFDQAKATALRYLSYYPTDTRSDEMHRILGEVAYHSADYYTAVKEFETYIAAGHKPQRNAMYMLGLAYYQTNVFSKATTALGEVVKVTDDLTQNAYFHLGLAYLQMAEKVQARMAFQQAAAMDTDMKIKEQASYNYALGIHETSFSAFGESVSVFERFLNEFPNSTYTPRISSYLVEVYLNTRSYDAALKSIERIARPDAQIMEAKQKILFQLGTESFANAAFAKAVDYFTQSIAIGQYNRQTNAEAHYWRGEAYYRLNRMAEAPREFNDYLRLNQQTNTQMYALAHYNLGYLAFNRKDYPMARNYFEKYTNLNRDGDKTTLADAYNRIADSYLETRNFNEAKQYYSQAEALDTPAGDYSFYQLAQVSGFQKDYAGKITILNRLSGKYPSSPYVVNSLYEKGRSYVLMNNSSQAISAFRELLAKYPESPVSRKAAAEIGLLYYQNDNYDQAIAAYKHVIEAYPGSEEARLALRDLKSIFIDLNRIDEFAALAGSLPGNIRFDVNEQDSLTYVAAEKIYMRGRIDEAKASFTRYIQSFPDGAFGLNAHYYLTIIANQQKDFDQVIYHSDKLLEYPDNPFSEEALVMRSEVQYNLQRYQDALASYKMLKEKASTTDRRILAETGILRSAFMLRDDTEIIHAASDLLTETKLDPEITVEAYYYRAKAFERQKADQAALADLRVLAKDTRNLFGAEAKFLVAEYAYKAGNYEAAEKELLNFIEMSTPHAYWLARGFVLLSDVYVAMDRQLDARQYLLSLQQNYQGNDDIQYMIETRLAKLNN